MSAQLNKLIRASLLMFLISSVGIVASVSVAQTEATDSTGATTSNKKHVSKHATSGKKKSTVKAKSSKKTKTGKALTVKSAPKSAPNTANDAANAPIGADHSAGIGARLSRDIVFDGSNVNGQYHSAGEAVAKVEQEKKMNNLIGIRQDFKDRLTVERDRLKRGDSASVQEN